MNTKSILITGLLAIVLVLAGLFASRDSGSEAAEGADEDAVVFPGLYDGINEITELVVATNDAEFHVKLEDGKWTLVERDGYPVSMDKVRSTLIGIAELEPVERKTDDPARYSELGVQALGADPMAETQSKQVTLKNAAGKTVAALIIGKARSGGRGGTFYVRKPTESASWLVEGEQPSLPESGDEWLDKKVIEVKRADVSAARITHDDGEVLTISKLDSETNFKLHEMPEGRELSYEGVAGGIAGALQYVNFESVSKAADFEAPDHQTSVTNVWTKDGLRITAQLWEKDEKVYGTFQAAYDLDGIPTLELGPLPPSEEGVAVAKATPRPKSEVEAEVAKLNGKLSPWVFQLPTYTKTNLTKRIDGLLKPLPKPEEVEDEAEASDPDAPISIDSFGGPVENDAPNTDDSDSDGSDQDDE